MSKIIKLGPCLPLFAAALCALPLSANAGDGIDHSWTEERNTQTIRVNEDGTYVATMEYVERIDEERAIAQLAQISIEYERTREEIEVVSAYTLKHDGRKLMIGPDGIREQQGKQGAGESLFHDKRVKVLIFPNVDVGDRIVYTYRSSHKSPPLAGYFQDYTTPDPRLARTLSLTYDMPKTMPLYADNRGFRAARPRLQGGRKIWHWELPPGVPPREESGSVAFEEYGPRLWVSTFHDYAEQARAYDRAAAGKAVAGPKLAALTLDVTKDAADDRAKAYKIAEWVRTNVRYAMGDLEISGFEPNSADVVYERLLGDGKDHATLVEAMLRVVGVDSTPALINCNGQYHLPGVPVMFHHVINYVPSLKLYLDTSYYNIAQPYLAQEEQDKPVLLTHSGTLGHTPGGDRLREKYSTEVRVDSAGNATFTEVQTEYGVLAEPIRKTEHNMSTNDRDQAVRNEFRGRGSATTGKLLFSHNDGDESASLHFQGKISNFVDLPGPVGIAMRSSGWDGIQQMLKGYASETSRTHDFLCPAFLHEESAHYTLPANVDILALPAPLDLHDPVLDYHASYERDGAEVTVKRIVVVHNDGIVCKAADFAAMRTTLDKIGHDLRAQLILQLRTAPPIEAQAVREQPR